MTNWYDGLTQEDVERLQKIKTPFGMLDENDQEILKKANEYKKLQYYNTSGRWSTYCVWTLVKHETFRLSPDFKLPKPDSYPEHNVCEVKLEDNCWQFLSPHNCWESFSDRESIPGYDGVEFEEWPGKRFPGMIWFQKDHHSYDPRLNFKPGTPKHVYFRKGE